MPSWRWPRLSCWILTSWQSFWNNLSPPSTISTNNLKILFSNLVPLINLRHWLLRTFPKRAHDRGGAPCVTSYAISLAGIMSDLCHSPSTSWNIEEKAQSQYAEIPWYRKSAQPSRRSRKCSGARRLGCCVTLTRVQAPQPPVSTWIANCESSYSNVPT